MRPLSSISSNLQSPINQIVVRAFLISRMPSLTTDLYLQKVEELRQLEQVLASTQKLADGLEDMVGDVETMGDGAQQVGLLLANWQNVIQAAHLGSVGAVEGQSCKLVRIPLKEAEEEASVKAVGDEGGEKEAESEIEDYEK